MPNRTEPERRTLTSRQIARALDICRVKPPTFGPYVGLQYDPDIVGYWYRLLRREHYSHDEAQRMAEFIRCAEVYFEDALKELQEKQDARQD